MPSLPNVRYDKATERRVGAITAASRSPLTSPTHVERHITFLDHLAELLRD